MNLELELKQRSGERCELSQSTEKLAVYKVLPANDTDASRHIYISEKCIRQIEKKEELEPKFWTFLKESVWSEVPAVQVVSWRMLNRLKDESWATEVLDMMYLPDDVLEWAKAEVEPEELAQDEVHKDSNGTILNTGDSVLLTKSLDVKGSSINAKIGTLVKNIKLVHDNTDQIEGKIDGQQIVILTKFVRKSG